MNPILAKKIFNQASHIDGWFSFEAAMLMAMLDEFQKENGVTGDVFEIGVHHGRSAVFFSQLLTKKENIHICDLFGLLGNQSHSGDGNREIFTGNMDKLGLKQPSAIHNCLSSELTKEKIGSNYRLFHVDGGHNTEEAFGDLVLASEALHEKGVIVLDDPFRVEWPGVTEAAIKFLSVKPEFQSIVVGFNKLLITRKKAAPAYTEYLTSSARYQQYFIQFPWLSKKVPFVNAEMTVFFVPQRYLSLKSAKVWFLKNILKRS